MESFIRNKYERKQYLKKDGIPPSRTTNNFASKEIKTVDKVKLHLFDSAFLKT